MAGIGFSGNDWLGIGGGISAQRVEGCGVRPILGKRQSEYDDCVKKMLEIKMLEARNTGGTKSLAESEGSNKTIYIVGGAILLVVLVLIFKK